MRQRDHDDEQNLIDQVGHEPARRARQRMRDHDPLGSHEPDDAIQRLAAAFGSEAFDILVSRPRRSRTAKDPDSAVTTGFAAWRSRKRLRGSYTRRQSRSQQTVGGSWCWNESGVKNVERGSATKSGLQRNDKLELGHMK